MTLFAIANHNRLFMTVTRRLSNTRPLSPHLTVYSIQLTTVLSIGHRMTGVALGTLVYGFGVVSTLSSVDVSKAAKWIKDTIPQPLVSASKFVISLPFTYHSFNGIRHLIWDLGYCLSINSVYKTGYAVLAATVASSSVLATI